VELLGLRVRQMRSTPGLADLHKLLSVFYGWRGRVGGVVAMGGMMGLSLTSCTVQHRRNSA
jgi:hypothetical protein